MKAAELLEALTRNPRDDEAAGELRELLHGFARSLRFEEDVVSAVEVTLWSKWFNRDVRRLPCIAEGDGACKSYLRRMVINKAADEARRRSREAPVSEDDEAIESRPDLSGSIADPAEALDNAETMALVRRARDHARARRAERYRAAFDRSWDQAIRLVVRGESMDAVLAADEGSGQNATAGDRAAARDRVYKGQERLRTEIREAVVDLVEKGELTHDEAESVHRFFRCFVRCQRPVRPAVGGVKDATMAQEDDE